MIGFRGMAMQAKRDASGTTIVLGCAFELRTPPPGSTVTSRPSCDIENDVVVAVGQKFARAPGRETRGERHPLHAHAGVAVIAEVVHRHIHVKRGVG
jgi:hypothetical protein